MQKGMPNLLLKAFSTILGPIPVLSTEDAKHYNVMWKNLILSFRPRNFMELLLIRQVQDETWRILRYTRHRTVSIDRRFRQSLEFQSQRMKEQKARREALAKELAEKTGKPITDFARLMQLEGTIESSVADVDDILQRTPTEIDHNRALEAGIIFEEQLDRLTNSALGRRNDAIEQLELYREGLGKYWRLFSDELIVVGSVVAKLTEPSPVTSAPGDELPGEVLSPDVTATFDGGGLPDESIPPGVATTEARETSNQEGV